MNSISEFNYTKECIFFRKKPKTYTQPFKSLVNYKPDFDFKKIKINEVGRYSITRPYEAKQITTIIRGCLTRCGKSPEESVITDGTSGVGGDTIHLSKHFKRVIAVDILNENTDLLRTNCETFGITNVTIINADYTEILNDITQDVLYLDPPWGGIGYKEKDVVDLTISGILLSEIIKRVDPSVVIFVKLPLNANVSRLGIKSKVKILNKKNIPSFYLVEISR